MVVAVAAKRILPAEAAVGLLSRDRSTLRGTLGGGGGGAALRALASDAAVGANKPDVGSEDRAPAAAAAFLTDGVFGRKLGVFGRGVVVADVVGALGVAAVVVRGNVDGALRMPGPFDGVRGVGVLERTARAATVVAAAAAAAADDRTPVLWEDVDFEGDAGVLVGLGGAVGGRDMEADVREFTTGAGAGTGGEAGAGAGGGAGAGAAVSYATGVPGSSTVDETSPGGGVAGSNVGGAFSWDVPSADAGGASMALVPRKSADDSDVRSGGVQELVALAAVPFPFVLTGGHSRATRCSSFAASPVLLEVELVAREGEPEEVGCRFCCCSKRPMRFATD